MAVGSLSCGWGGGGVVEALGAALGMGSRRAQGKGRKEREEDEEFFCCPSTMGLRVG